MTGPRTAGPLRTTAPLQTNRRGGRTVGSLSLPEFLFLAVLALLLSAAPTQAQQIGRWQVVPRYSTVLPVGGVTRDFISDFSWRGATVDVVRFLSDGVRVGVSGGWHVLDGQSSGTEVFEGGAFTGDLNRYMNALPLMAIGLYEFGGRWGPKGFVGGGTGLIYVQNRVDTALGQAENSNWHWGLSAEAGIAIPRPGGSIWDVSARYHWAVENSGVERQYVTFSLGYRIGG